MKEVPKTSAEAIIQWQETRKMFDDGHGDQKEIEVAVSFFAFLATELAEQEGISLEVLMPNQKDRLELVSDSASGKSQMERDLRPFMQ